MRIPREVNVRLLQVALQWALLGTVAATLLTRYWYQHEPVAWLLLGMAVAAWWPDLRRGVRRWWFFYVVGILIYTLLRAQADGFLTNARFQYVIEIDRFMFGGTDPVVWLQNHLFSPPRIDLIDIAAVQIHWSYFLVPHLIALLIYIQRRHLFAPFIQRMLGVQYVGLIFFFITPTAPPWLASRSGDLDPVYRVMNFVGRSMDRDTYTSMYRALGEPNSVAAVPSLHMAVTVALYLWVRRFVPRLRWFFLGYCALMAFALVHLAEHYVFDLLVGAAIAVLVDRVVAWRTRSPRLVQAEPSTIAPAEAIEAVA
ncbi:MAG: phosphatase PAP2 family protein [Chloroflexi bacterium]|nr:phosphatase PAP2 family protein [Chloroflexota bacterium]MDA1240296.1 phosphatase PAP2 family protein [Chloroflexota bacterium]